MYISFAQLTMFGALRTALVTTRMRWFSYVLVGGATSSPIVALRCCQNLS